MENLVEFWRGKKVLITGHTGFKGSWLSLLLQSLNAEVTGFALPCTDSANLYALANVNLAMTSLYGDIRDLNLLQDVINKHSPEIVLHLAAQSLVRYSYKEPLETYSTNVMGTVHLLEAVRRSNSVKVVINVTSDKCYENRESTHGYQENDPLGGHDPYSNSKACSELITSAYRASYFNSNEQNKISVASVRAGNVIGGGDWAQDRLVPDIIRACLNQSALVIRNPDAIRPWQHVLDPLSGYLVLAQKLYEHPLGYAEAWNFGPEERDANSVRWLVDYLCNLWGHAIPTDFTTTALQPHETNNLKLNCAKSREKLNWKPIWSVEKALQETVNWYKAYQQDENIRQLTLAQIDDYKRLAELPIK